VDFLSLSNRNDNLFKDRLEKEAQEEEKASTANSEQPAVK
jgi:hypothetical protein